LKKLIQNISHTEFFIFWCIVLVSSLAWSKFLLSVSIWALIITALFHIKKYRYAQLRLHQWVLEYLQFWKWKITTPLFLNNLFKNPAYIAVSLSFFLVVISGLWSEDIGYWLSRVRIKIPLLVLPVAFSLIPPLSKKQYLGIWYAFFITFTLFSIYHLLYYAAHFEETNKGLGQGIPLKSFKSHIVFTTMTAFAVMTGIELWLNQFFLKYVWERKAILAATVFLILALHIFSVRTGLLTFYVCFFIKILDIIFKQKKIIAGIIALSAMTAIPVLAYTFVPSFQQRVNYAIWDFQQYKAGNAGDKSDSDRIVSLKVGWEIAKQHPVIGVGFGDIMQETAKTYGKLYPHMRPREPHSFILFTAVGVGFVGLLIWLIAIAFPLFYKRGYQDALFLQFNVAFMTGNIVDYIVEGTLWAVFYAFAVSLFLNQYNKKDI
jgi:O-antigen ligase